MQNLIITIDGPTASGKTTIAKKLSENLGIFHLKGGIFLRSTTLFCLNNNIRIHSHIAKASEQLDLKVVLNNRAEFSLYLEDLDVSNKLWNREIDSFVPEIANIPRVRIARKKWLITVAKGRDLVADGRTLGSEIFPNASYKFFLTCSLEERAKRRAMQDNYVGNLSSIKNDISARDRKDMEGLVNRLQPPDNAINIDSTNLSINSVIDQMMQYIKCKS